MNERLNTPDKNCQDVGSGIALGCVENLPYFVSLGMTFLAGNSYEHGDYFGTGLFLSCASINTVLKFRIDQMRRNRDISFMAHLAAEMLTQNSMEREIALRMGDLNHPLYQSMDKSSTITDPAELLVKIGKPDAAVLRVGVILGHVEKGTVTDNEIETLRMMKSGANFIGLDPSQVCDTGQEMFEKMEVAILNYEKKFQSENPTSQE